tara:strand:+ start:537 stop:968 length:432 start_codon:yes stop_codon:yes gene_type:complete
MSFSNVLKYGERDVSVFSYTCSVCQNTQYGKPWMMYSDNNQRLNICRYICYNKCDNIRYENVVNKGDFNTLFPKLTIDSSFKLLDKQEVSNMNKSQYDRYMMRVEEHFMMNPQRYQDYVNNLWENDVVEKQDTERDTLHVESY